MGAGWPRSAPGPAQGEAGRDGHGKRQLVAAAGETEPLRGQGPPASPGDGRGGRDASGGTGGGGSARLPGNLKCDKSGKRGVGGREVSPHPTPLTFRKKGGAWEKSRCWESACGEGGSAAAGSGSGCGAGGSPGGSPGSAAQEAEEEEESRRSCRVTRSAPKLESLSARNQERPRCAQRSLARSGGKRSAERPRREQLAAPLRTRQGRGGRITRRQQQQPPPPPKTGRRSILFAGDQGLAHRRTREPAVIS
ncbi:unnamed protein product [Coccothraustes coccothraustes]